jgi:hypothetical protein
MFRHPVQSCHLLTYHRSRRLPRRPHPAQLDQMIPAADLITTFTRLESVAATMDFFGKTSVYCKSGFQPLFGTCDSTSVVDSVVPAASSPASGSGTVSTNNTCGGVNGYVCPGSQCKFCRCD